VGRAAPGAAFQFDGLAGDHDLIVAAETGPPRVDAAFEDFDRGGHAPVHFVTAGKGFG
jgi:hypothetical protein